MSMEISGSYGQYKDGYAKRLQSGQEQVKEAQERKEESFDKKPVLQDEYLSSEKSASRPAGLYRAGRDKNGNPKIFFDDPGKDEDTDKKGQPQIKPDTPEKSEEKCTADTDKTDREIEKLKEKKKQLVQQIQSASGNEKKVRELEKKLAQVESELSRKDNDAYRRQNAEIS